MNSTTPLMEILITFVAGELNIKPEYYADGEALAEAEAKINQLFEEAVMGDVRDTDNKFVLARDVKRRWYRSSK